MVGSIVPRGETLRGIQWPVEVAWLYGTRVAETILASGPKRPHQQAGHMDCKRSDHTLKALVARGPSTYGFRVRAHSRAPRNDGKGCVTLVGAGPGDPELLTLKAVRALQDADVILFDNLVAPEILDFARREARTMLVGKTGHGPSCRQDDINALMVKLARSGKRVVRLKGGDPMVFGRAGEEIAACRAAGIPVDVIPGITAAQGAAARLAVSLTHRDHARRLQYVTGHDRRGVLPDLGWTSLADPAATTVVYMPTKTLAPLAERAIAAGLDAATPAVAVARATRSDEEIIVGTIATLSAVVAARAPRGPVLVMIGWALADAGIHMPANEKASATTAMTPAIAAVQRAKVR